MGVGDVPTWVAAVAAWAGVVVNALIVFVALSPIRTAKRERIARGRLVAAYLMVPITEACKYMHLACEDLDALLKSDGLLDSDKSELLLANLGNTRDWVPPLLGRFDLSEAAYLDEGMGEKLAQAVGATNTAIASLSTTLDAFAFAGKFSTADRVLEARKEVVAHIGYLPSDLRAAKHALAVFVAYCGRIFPSSGE